MSTLPCGMWHCVIPYGTWIPVAVWQLQSSNCYIHFTLLTYLFKPTIVKTVVLTAIIGSSKVCPCAYFIKMKLVNLPSRYPSAYFPCQCSDCVIKGIIFNAIQNVFVYVSQMVWFLSRVSTAQLCRVQYWYNISICLSVCLSITHCV